MDFLKELKWRGLIQDVTNGFDEEVKKNSVTAYIGFDPTSDSLCLLYTSPSPRDRG